MNEKLLVILAVAAVAVMILLLVLPKGERKEQINIPAPEVEEINVPEEIPEQTGAIALPEPEIEEITIPDTIAPETQPAGEEMGETLPESSEISELELPESI